jgi:hypothetical protein
VAKNILLSRCSQISWKSMFGNIIW